MPEKSGYGVLSNYLSPPAPPSMTSSTDQPSKLLRALAYALLLVTMVIWASAFVGIRRVLQETDAFSLTTARMLIAAASMLALGAIARVKLPSMKDTPLIAAAGFCGFALYNVALNIGMTDVPAGQASLLTATTPLWTSLLAWKFLRERPGLFGIIGLLASVCGVGYLSMGAGDLSLQLGSLLVLLAAFAAAVNLILQKRLLERYSPLELSVFVTISGASPFLLYLPYCAEELTQMSTHAKWVTLYLGVGPIGLGYILSTIALKVLSAGRSAQMVLLVPPITALIAWAWLGEQLDAKVIGGGLLILAGVLVGGLRSPKAIHRQAAGDCVRDPALEGLER